MDGFGERLRKLRKERDVTQTALAEVIGVVPSAIGKYERLPQSFPSVEALVKIAAYSPPTMAASSSREIPTKPCRPRRSSCCTSMRCWAAGTD